MVDKQYLQDLLAILKLHSVKHIKMQGLELEFHGEQSLQNMQQLNLSESPNSSVQNIVDAVKKQELALPPDLRADALMDQDKILNWSSPDQRPFEEEPEMPLTGEMPL